MKCSLWQNVSKRIQILLGANVHVTMCIVSLSSWRYPALLLRSECSAACLVEYLRDMPLFPLRSRLLWLFHSPSALPWQSSLVGQMASEAFFFPFHFNLSRFHHSFIQHLMYCLIWRGEVAWFQHAQCHGELRWQGAVLLPRGSSKALSAHLPQISSQREAGRQTEMDCVPSVSDRTWACSEWRCTRATKGPACMMIMSHLWCAGRCLILYSKFIGMFIIILHN